MRYVLGLVLLTGWVAAGFRHPHTIPHPLTATRAFALTTDKPGHLYLTSENVKLNAKGLSDGQAVTLHLTNSRGGAVTATPTVAGGVLDLGKVGPGWYHLNVQDPGGPSDDIDFAVARPRTVQGFRDSSPFGLTQPPKNAPEWQLFGDMGVSWLQWAIPWAYAETKPGVYWFSPGAPKYDDYEGYVKEANKRGIRTVLQMRTTPPWAVKGNIGSYKGDEAHTGDIYPPDDAHWDAFENFIGVVVDRFKPLGVKHYEMWSEAEGSLFQRYNTALFPKVEAYQKMLQHAHTALRSHDSNAILIGPGDEPVDLLRNAENGYTAKATFNGKPDPYAGMSLPGIGKGTVDIVSGHFYWTDWQSSPRRLWHPEERNPGRRDMTLKEMIGDAKQEGGSRPVWNTEVGYGSAKSEETPDQMWAAEDEQANLLVRYYLLSLAWGAQKVFWYTWKDTPSTSYGLLRRDGTVKASYIAYRTMTEKLEGLSFDRLLKSGPDVWIARFTGPRTVMVAWKTTSGTSSQKATFMGSSAAITERDGRSGTTLSPGGNFSLVGTEPVYIEVVP